ncbi:MAG: threonine synthase, partial [Clostridia bacterium]|nr:threonine synthase [Clostridia bacterium]
MQTQEGKNVSVTAIKGNFDDAQSGVKKIFSDEEFKKTLDNEGVFLSSANSINWGRLVPQIVYYVSAYSDLYAAGKISLGEKIDVCVPTGNFGNIFAAYIAKLMGLPIEKLVCASNMNHVLTDFLKNGVYDKNRSFYATMSPSMDILISSNLERLLYVTLGAEKTAGYMDKLNTFGKYELSREDFLKVSESFVGYYTDEKKTQETISRTLKNKNCLIDTHTAVAVSAAESYICDYKAERKMLVVSTASAFKFANDVLSSIRGYKEESDLSAPSMLEKLTGVKMPSPLASVLTKEIIHTEIIESCDMKSNTEDFAKN